MDFDGEPSRFLDYDVDTSRRISLTRAVSFPSWHDLLSHRGFEEDSCLLIGSCDFSLSAAHSSESKAQIAVSNNTTDWKLKQGREGATLVRCETWSYMCAGPTDVGLESESSLVLQQSTIALDDSRADTFTAGEESTEKQNAFAVCNISSTSTSESRQCSKLEPNAQDRLLNLRDLVPAQTEHSVILSAFKSFDQLISSRRGSREVFCENQNDAQSCSYTEASQLQSSIVQQQHQTADSYVSTSTKLFGLPGHITVSKREMNMMSPTSF